MEREIGRLVKAIRTTDAPELVEALDHARRERQSVQAALQQAGLVLNGQSLDDEAAAIVDGLWGLAERLNADDPAVVRDVFRKLVSRIECRWEALPIRGKGLLKAYRLVGGVVYLRNPLLFTCANDASA